MTSPIINNKVIYTYIYIYKNICTCFTYIVPKPAAEFLHVLLLNNISGYMKREISLDLCVHYVDKRVSVKLENCT